MQFGATRVAQKLVVSLNAKLRDGPIALPEKRPPKSITFTMFVKFRPSTWKWWSCD